MSFFYQLCFHRPSLVLQLLGIALTSCIRVDVLYPRLRDAVFSAPGGVEAVVDAVGGGQVFLAGDEGGGVEGFAVEMDGGEAVDVPVYFGGGAGGVT